MVAWLMVWMALASVLPEGLSTDDMVTLENGVAYAGAVMPTEATPGGAPVELKLYFPMAAVPEGNIHSFVHVESPDRTTCRTVRDTPLVAPRDGVAVQTIALAVPGGKRCAVGERLELYVGLYDRSTGSRVEVVDPPAPADRIHAGWLELVAEGTASTQTQAIAPSAMARSAIWAALRPWRGWMAGLALSIAIAVGLALWVARRGSDGLDDPLDELTDVRAR
ncbi:MAG: hypothetical protein AAFS10_04765, partial [Myxococcota bacterium]